MATINGSHGNDSISGTSLDESIYGHEGDDVIAGGAGNDSIAGGTGDDRLAGEAGADGLDGGTGDDLLEGGEGSDTLEGGTGDDLLEGGDGDDTLDGGEGDDWLTGGSGADTFVYQAGGKIDVVTDLGAGDSVTIIGYQSAQSITQVGPNVIVVLLGGDLIIFQNTNIAAVQAALSFGASNVIDGTPGDDILTGTSADETINGYAGNDRLNGGAGDDLMTGGTGNDTYYVDSLSDAAVENAGEGNDTVRSSLSWTLGANLENLVLTTSADLSGTGNALNNVITGNSGANLLRGEGGNDRLNGGDGNDTLQGGDGHDRLDGGAGDDSLAGGLGNDIYYVGSAGDTVAENVGEGTDSVRSTISWTLGDNLETLVLTGSGDTSGTGNGLNNVITGNAGANVLRGEGGDDRVVGGAGNDSIEGGAGRDTVFGGSGADSFVFREGDFAGSTAAAADKIGDFSQADGDVIDLSLVDADTLTTGDQGFNFIGSGEFTNTAGELRTEVINGHTFVWGDTDGDGTADFIIRVNGSHALVEGDFII